MKFMVRDLVVITLAGAIAVLSARSYAGGYNDGGRLASIESLVDYGTWQIDRSIFSGDAHGGRPEIWPPGDPLPDGTGDKLYIRGHFYSDKPPVTALLMAVIYQVLQWTTGLVARQSPNAFCYWMTLTSSGVAYVLAVWCIDRTAVRSRLHLIPAAILTASFALATVAPAYARQVNASILLLATASGLMLVLARIGEAGASASWSLTLAAGLLTGFAYTTDLASGPILLACSAAFVWHQTGYRLRPVIWLGLGSLPWLVAHHLLNYAIGGTIRPMNMVPDYFDWPNSTFDRSNLTGGGAGPKSLLAFLWYLRGFLVGARGFLCHNFVLLLTIPATVAILRSFRTARPLVLTYLAWSAGTVLIYALKSSDYSGTCIAVRWLIPTLAAGFLILVRRLESEPGTIVELVVVSLASLPISLADWRLGTFSNNSLRHLPIWIVSILTLWLVSFLVRTGRLPLHRFATKTAGSPARI